jgi:hypothetical protein
MKARKLAAGVGVFAALAVAAPVVAAAKDGGDDPATHVRHADDGAGGAYDGAPAAPAPAEARNGADDPATDTRNGTDDAATDTRDGSDDAAAAAVKPATAKKHVRHATKHVRHGRGADDGAKHR